MGLKSPNLLQNLTWKGKLSLLMIVHVLFNWILGIYFGGIIIQFYFSSCYDVIGGQKGRKDQKSPISPQMVIRTCKCSQICYPAWEIRWCHLFTPYLNIWPILRHLRGQKGGQKGQNFSSPHKWWSEPVNLVRYAIQHEKFDGILHFHHIWIFDPFWGTLGVKRKSKW